MKINKSFELDLFVKLLDFIYSRLFLSDALKYYVPPKFDHKYLSEYFTSKIPTTYKSFVKNGHKSKCHIDEHVIVSLNMQRACI